MADTGIVGPQALAQGAAFTIRGSFDGSLITQDGHARFQEAVQRGFCFWAGDATARLLNSPSTTPVGMTLANPSGSGKNLVLWYAAGSHNGTVITTGGVVQLEANLNTAAAAVTAGTAVTIRNCLIGGGGNTVASASVAATLPASPTALLSLGLATTGAATVQMTAAPLGGFLDGSLILVPNTAVTFGSTATLVGAGGGIINCTLVWEEVPTSA